MKTTAATRKFIAEIDKITAELQNTIDQLIEEHMDENRFIPYDIHNVIRSLEGRRDMWNLLREGAVKDRPVFVNYSIGSDTYPYEVVEWISPKKIKIREMNFRARPGAEMYTQDWIIEPNTSDNAREEVIVYKETKRKKGWYIGGNKVWIAEKPTYHYDWSF